jgi:hypothetical protein
MRLYQAEFGLTDDRFYATAFMAWLGVIVLWFGASVLRGRRQNFAVGVLATGVLAALALNVANPDAFIVRTNLERMTEGKRFDAAYNSSLSADAVPVLTEWLDQLTPAQQCLVSRRLLRTTAVRSTRDWRGWSWSRWQAERAVDRHGDVIERAARIPAGPVRTNSDPCAAGAPDNKPL